MGFRSGWSTAMKNFWKSNQGTTTHVKAVGLPKGVEYNYLGQPVYADTGEKYVKGKPQTEGYTKSGSTWNTKTMEWDKASAQDLLYPGQTTAVAAGQSSEDGTTSTTVTDMATGEEGVEPKMPEPESEVPEESQTDTETNTPSTILTEANGSSKLVGVYTPDQTGTNPTYEEPTSTYPGTKDYYTATEEELAEGEENYEDQGTDQSLVTGGEVGDGVGGDAEITVGGGIGIAAPGVNMGKRQVQDEGSKVSSGNLRRNIRKLSPSLISAKA